MFTGSNEYLWPTCFHNYSSCGDFIMKVVTCENYLGWDHQIILVSKTLFESELMTNTQWRPVVSETNQRLKCKSLLLMMKDDESTMDAKCSLCQKPLALSPTLVKIGEG